MVFLRQRMERLRQHDQRLCFDGRLASSGTKHRAGHPHEVSNVKIPLEKFVLLLTDNILPQVDLNLARTIKNMRKRGLPHVPDAHQTTGYVNRRRLMFSICLSFFKQMAGLTRGVTPFDTRWVRINAGLAHTLQLNQTLLFLIAQFLWHVISSSNEPGQFS